jgi:hypothetical protein
MRVRVGGFPFLTRLLQDVLIFVGKNGNPDIIYLFSKSYDFALPTSVRAAYLI